MATVFKSVLPGDYSITPFPAFYDYRFTYTSGSTTNSSDVSVSYAVRYDTASAQFRTPNDSQELFDSIRQTFYSPAARSLYGIASGSSYIPVDDAWVIGVSQDLFGQRIVPGTFSVEVNGTRSRDDGIGNLFISNSIVGAVFYDKGVALLLPTQSISAGLTVGGLSLVSGSTMAVDFTSSVELYEHSIKVRVSPTEFLYSLANPTAAAAVSGSTTAASLMHVRQLLPYSTTIGMYNDANELLAVAKLSIPIQRTSDISQTFIIKFDT